MLNFLASYMAQKTRASCSFCWPWIKIRPPQQRRKFLHSMLPAKYILPLRFFEMQPIISLMMLGSGRSIRYIWVIFEIYIPWFIASMEQAHPICSLNPISPQWQYMWIYDIASNAKDFSKATKVVTRKTNCSLANTVKMVPSRRTIEGKVSLPRWMYT